MFLDMEARSPRKSVKFRIRQLLRCTDKLYGSVVLVGPLHDFNDSPGFGCVLPWQIWQLQRLNLNMLEP